MVVVWCFFICRRSQAFKDVGCLPDLSGSKTDTLMPTDNLTPFLEELLNVSAPWRITDICKSDTDLTILVTIEYAPSSSMKCPECGDVVGSRHDTVNRELRDLNWSTYQVTLHVKVPRIRCPKHGVVRLDVPWVTRYGVGTT